nr:pilus assembly protein TadG-related protein [Jiella flava]
MTASTAGSIAVTFALTLPVVLGASAFAVDVGSAYLERRSLQSATDAAALAAAQRPDEAQTVVETMLAANGFKNAKAAVQIGQYTKDPKIDRDARFAPAVTGNAIRVTAATTMPFIFGKLLGMGEVEISTRSDAALFPVVSFSAGSRLASAEPDLLNAIVGPLLGGGIGLTVLDYQSLAGATVDLGGLLTGLSASLPADANRTTLDLIGQSFKVSAIATAMSQAMASQGNLPAASALQKIANSPLLGNATTSMNDLITFDDYQKKLAIQYPPSIFSADISVLDLIFASLRSQGIGTTGNVNLNLPYVASISLAMQIGEGMQSAKSVAVGGVGSKIATDQVRTRLSISTAAIVAGLKPLQIPLEAVVAGGSAEVVGATCSLDPSAREVKLAVLPGIARASIGHFDKPLSDANVGDRLDFATIVDALLAKVRAKGNVAAEQTTPIIVTFRGSEIGDGTIKTARTQTLFQSLTTSLLRDTEVQVSVLGLGLSSSLIQQAVSNVLIGLSSPLDNVLNTTLAVAGVGLGELDVRVDNLSCGNARIVG